MQQIVDAIELVSLPELNLNQALDVGPAKRTDLVLLLRSSVDPIAEAGALIPRKPAGPSLPQSTAQSIHPALVVSPNPFLDRPRTHIQRPRDFRGRATLNRQHDRLHANPHARITFHPRQTPQFVESMTTIHVHPASPSKRTRRIVHELKPGARARSYFTGLV
jgi:hypothetical protein